MAGRYISAGSQFSTSNQHAFHRALASYFDKASYDAELEHCLAQGRQQHQDRVAGLKYMRAACDHQGHAVYLLQITAVKASSKEPVAARITQYLSKLGVSKRIHTVLTTAWANAKHTNALERLSDDLRDGKQDRDERREVFLFDHILWQTPGGWATDLKLTVEKPTLTVTIFWAPPFSVYDYTKGVETGQQPWNADSKQYLDTPVDEPDEPRYSKMLLVLQEIVDGASLKPEYNKSVAKETTRQVTFPIDVVRNCPIVEKLNMPVEAGSIGELHLWLYAWTVELLCISHPPKALSPGELKATAVIWGATLPVYWKANEGSRVIDSFGTVWKVLTIKDRTVEARAMRAAQLGRDRQLSGHGRAGERATG